MQLKITLKMWKSIIHQKNPKSNGENVHKIKQKKTRIEIAGDSMVNGIDERGMDETNQFNIKGCR